MSGGARKKLLYLLDDGWRYEKQEIIHFLKEREVDFDIVTHDEQTCECLKAEFEVHLIPIHSLKRNPFYALAMFFAKELKTKTVTLFARLRYHEATPLMKLLYSVRALVGCIGLRRYTYCDALAMLYKRSRHYAELLQGYDELLYSPIGVMDKRIIYEAKNGGMKVVSWVFSWDNPMKDNEFIPNADRYLVWNEENAKDLKEMYAIERDRIDIVGPVQFDYLLENRKAWENVEKENYVLYACSMGLTYYIEQEIDIILRLRAVLDEVAPEMKLLVRPYPFRDVAAIYNRLAENDGIEVAHFGSFEGRRALISKQDLEDKILQIQRAACFINMASTIVLEASFTDTPIVQLCYSYPHRFSACQDLVKILENDHLKYILEHNVPNMVSTEKALSHALGEILHGDQKPYRAYSKKLNTFADPLGVESYKEVFLGKISRYT